MSFFNPSHQPELRRYSNYLSNAKQSNKLFERFLGHVSRLKLFSFRLLDLDTSDKNNRKLVRELESKYLSLNLLIELISEVESENVQGMSRCILKPVDLKGISGLKLFCLWIVEEENNLRANV